MPAASLSVRELPFRLPDSKPREVLTYADVNFIATEGPLGGHTQNDIGTSGRTALRQFLKSSRADLYYNGVGDFPQEGADIVVQVGDEQARKRREKEAIFWVRNRQQLDIATIEAVKQVWTSASASPTATTLPASLNKYIQDQFEALVNALPQAQKASLSGWRVAAGAPPDISPSGESLWLKQSSKTLWISPSLVRGLLLQSTQAAAEGEYNRYLSNPTLTTKLFGNPDVVASTGMQFHNSIRYLLAHSIEHVVLAGSTAPAADKEIEIDRAARALAGNSSTGAFRPFLEQSIKISETSNSWGVEKADDGEAVLQRIKLP
jgi:hypothetical protein